MFVMALLVMEGSNRDTCMDPWDGVVPKVCTAKGLVCRAYTAFLQPGAVCTVLRIIAQGVNDK